MTASVAPAARYVTRWHLVVYLAAVAIFIASECRTLKGLDAVDVAIQQIGKPYAWNGKGPNLFDCSGLIQYSYSQVGVTLPAGSVSQAGAGGPITGSLRRGDLVFFDMLNQPPKAVNHVGIIEVGSTFIAAPGRNKVVGRRDLADAFWQQRFLFGRRITTSPTFNLEAIGRGSYDLDGSPDGALPGSYFMGYCNFADSRCRNGGVPASELRNWFRFDLSSVAGPVTAATLLLDSPGLLTGCRGCTPASTATYTVFDVTPSNEPLLGTRSVVIWTDLGSGTSYGSFTAHVGDMATASIPLSAAAIAAINANRGKSFAVGGTITSHPNPFEFQYLFSTTRSGSHSVLELR